jgi:hypothetical protein
MSHVLLQEKIQEILKQQTLFHMKVSEVDK